MYVTAFNVNNFVIDSSVLLTYSVKSQNAVRTKYITAFVSNNLQKHALDMGPFLPVIFVAISVGMLYQISHDISRICIVPYEHYFTLAYEMQVKTHSV